MSCARDGGYCFAVSSDEAETKRVIRRDSGGYRDLK